MSNSNKCGIRAAIEGISSSDPDAYLKVGVLRPLKLLFGAGDGPGPIALPKSDLKVGVTVGPQGGQFPMPVVQGTPHGDDIMVCA